MCWWCAAFSFRLFSFRCWCEIFLDGHFFFFSDDSFQHYRSRDDFNISRKCRIDADDGAGEFLSAADGVMPFRFQLYRFSLFITPIIDATWWCAAEDVFSRFHDAIYRLNIYFSIIFISFRGLQNKDDYFLSKLMPLDDDDFSISMM